jgi:GAF domain-containing protein
VAEGGKSARMPLDHHAVEASLTALTAATDHPGIADRRSLEDRIGQVIAVAGDVLPVDGMGLMLLDESGLLRMAGASDPPAVALERAQLRLGAGPGIDCVRDDATVAVDDLADSDTYAEVWAALAPDAVRAVLSVPVRVGESVVGTLNALGRRPRHWTSESVRATEAYAGVIAVMLRLSAAARKTAVSQLFAVEE